MRLFAQSARAARAALLIVALTLAGSALADIVVMKNGDRLTGRIRHLSSTTLQIDTPYAGKVEIEREQIASFSTRSTVAYLPHWGAEPKRAAFALGPSEGVVLIDDGERSYPAPLSTVAVLKPHPQETANGVAYAGRVTMSTGWSQGNSESKRIWVEGEQSGRARLWRYDTAMKVRHEQENGETTADNWLASANFDRFFGGETRFGYLRGSLEHDRFRSLSLKSTVGGGYGVQLIDNARTQLSLRGGLDLVRADRIDAPIDSYPAAGWGLKVEHQLVLANASLFHDQQGFAGFGDDGNVTLRSRSGVRVPIGNGLNASLQLNLDWERGPASGRHPTDTTWLLGLGYAW